VGSIQVSPSYMRYDTPSRPNILMCKSHQLEGGVFLKERNLIETLYDVLPSPTNKPLFLTHYLFVSFRSYEQKVASTGSKVYSFSLSFCSGAAIQNI
jgi:hypothetical protein